MTESAFEAKGKAFIMMKYMMDLDTLRYTYNDEKGSHVTAMTCFIAAEA